MGFDVDRGVRVLVSYKKTASFFPHFVEQPRILSNIQEGVAADMRGGSQRGPTIDRNTGARLRG